MISLVLQHLEDLHLELMAIDPSHRSDAADKVGEIAMDLRRTIAQISRAEADSVSARAQGKAQAAA